MSKLLLVLAALSVSVAVVATVAASAKVAASGQFEILTLSNRADHVSGGDALVEVRVPGTVPLHQVTLWLNGLDVTAAFHTDTAARTMRGVLTGLEVGQNEFLADSNGRGLGRPRASLAITNHPIGGPVLLGSQTTPWICATPTPTAASGNTPASNASGLSTFAIDTQCNIATEYKLFYRTTTAGCSSALPDPSPPAAPPTNNCFKPYTPGSDAGRSCHDHDDRRIDGAVHRARRARNDKSRHLRHRGSVRPQQPWSALSPQAQWNGKVVYSFGASTGQPRLQFRSSQNWADNAALSRGFMVVDNSLTDSAFNSNRVLNAETLMMMKEHIADTYGEISTPSATAARAARSSRIPPRRSIPDCSTASSRVATTLTRSPPASRSGTASCWSTSTRVRNGRR